MKLSPSSSWKKTVKLLINKINMLVQYYVLYIQNRRILNPDQFSGKVPEFAAEHSAHCLYLLFCRADVLTPKLLGFVSERIMGFFFFGQFGFFFPFLLSSEEKGSLSAGISTRRWEELKSLQSSVGVCLCSERQTTWDRSGGNVFFSVTAPQR